MKYVILVGDGMCDEPMPELGGRSPLEAAATPNPELLTHQGMVMQRFRLHGACSRALRHGTTA